MRRAISMFLAGVLLLLLIGCEERDSLPTGRPETVSSSQVPVDVGADTVPSSEENHAAEKPVLKPPHVEQPEIITSETTSSVVESGASPEASVPAESAEGRWYERYAWPIPLGHGPVNGIGYLHGGEEVVIGTPCGIQVRRATDLGFVGWIAPGREIGQLSLAKDGSLLAYRSDGSLLAHRSDSWHLLDVADGSELSEFSIPYTYDCATLSPDGRLLWNGAMYDVVTGEQIDSYGISTDCEVAFSPDGDYLATAKSTEDTSITIWDTRSASPVRDLRGHEEVSRKLVQGCGMVIAMAFSPDGQLLASAGQDGAIYLWNVSEERVIRTFDGALVTPSESAQALVFSHNGSLLAATDISGRLIVWDVKSGEAACVLGEYHDIDIFARSHLAFSPDDRSILVANNGWGIGGWKIQLWDIASEISTYSCSIELQGVQRLAFSNDRSLLLAGGRSVTGRRSYMLWDMENLGAVRVIETEDGDSVAGLSFSPTGDVLVTAGHFNTQVDILNVADGQWEKPVSLSYRLHNIALSPDGRQIAVCGESAVDVQLWDLTTRTLEEELGSSSPAASPAWPAYSSDGQRLATAGNGLIKLWDTSSYSLLETIRAQGTVRLGPTGKLFAIGGADSVRIQEAQTGAFRIVGEGVAGDMALSPDGAILAVWRDGRLETWDTGTGAAMDILELSSRFPGYCVTFSADGELLATGSAHMVLLWRLENDLNNR